MDIVTQGIIWIRQFQHLLRLFIYGNPVYLFYAVTCTDRSTCHVSCVTRHVIAILAHPAVHIINDQDTFCSCVSNTNQAINNSLCNFLKPEINVMCTNYELARPEIIQMLNVCIR